MYTEYHTYERDTRRYDAAVEFAVEMIKLGTVSHTSIASKAVEMADDLVTQIDEREAFNELKRKIDAEGKE